MVKPEQQREILGVVLLALSAFVLLALLPIHLIGGPLRDWFPSGNLIGVAGRSFRDGGWAFLGAGVFLLPFLSALLGLRFGEWMERERSIRMAVLAGGLLLIVPTFLHLAPVHPGWGGWLGAQLAAPLRGALGGFGAGLLVVVLFAVLTLATLGWNPFRPVLTWVWSGAREGWTRGADWLEGRGPLWSRDLSDDPSDSGEDDPDASKSGPSKASSKTESPEAHDDDTEREGGSEADLPWDDSPARALVDGSAVGTPGSQLDLLPDPRDPRELEGDELPSLELLKAPSRRGRRDMERELDALGDVLVEKLRTFNVESEIGGRTTGPVVTQYEVVPAPGVKVNRIANLDADLALAMKARTIRIVAPIPGKGAVGVEIPNPSPEIVQLREILEADQFTRSRAELPLALGKDLHGEPYVADLAKMPHALIAGATGSGKSVCLNTVITSLVYRHTPETLRLLLIDPKMVELSTYSDLPHLRHPVVTDPKDAAGVLKWAVLEMERRYTLLKENGVRSIGEFNRRLRKGNTMRRAEPVGEEGDPDRWIYDDGVLPFIVLVVDELADLMMSVQSEIEKPLTLLAQKARAIGIHLIVATQRPSVNVITGLIKANFPCRIAFRVASKTDSRTILDQNGADALLGNGDMLFLPPGESSPIRMQGAYIATAETDTLMAWFRELRERKLDEAGLAPLPLDREEDILELVRTVEAEEAGGDSDAIAGDWDELFQEAAEVCISNEQGSTSLLQRKLRIGYGRAARIVDQLHEAGVVGPPDGSKPRELLMTMDQLHRMLAGEEE
ncbi:MAG: DNA translocase FtsK [Gemmatimonadales bacterium]|nr:MAG: DNA translocase FtsK [Gemmatimonadales bacterium]